MKGCVQVVVVALLTWVALGAGTASAHIPDEFTNLELLANLPVVEEGSARQAVSCYTFHRGQAKP